MLVLVLSGERGPLATIFIWTLCRSIARAITPSQHSTSVRCVASRSRSIATYATTVTCTARPSIRATSVVAASAGPPPSRFIARLAARNWRRASNYRRMVKSGCCGVSVVFVSILSSASLCLVWMTVKRDDLFWITLVIVLSPISIFGFYFFNLYSCMNYTFFYTYSYVLKTCI